MKLELEVGKKYKNRKGNIIKITGTTRSDIFCFAGEELRIDNFKVNGTWMQDGYYWSDREESPYDLIEEIVKDTEDSKVNSPKHYNQGSIECIAYILDHKLNFLEGNVVKYVTRWRHKDGIKDLEKAKWYLNKLIDEEQKKVSNCGCNN